MHSDLHHRRAFWWILVLALLSLMLLARPAHSGWSTDPVEVHATSALCPLVGAADDARTGAIVVWQENTATGGLLRAQHLLANGDVDPAWSGPVAVSNLDAARTALGVERDGTGGAYVWWVEGINLWLTRLDASGAVAAGWPARGRSLGFMYSAAHLPLARIDGSGGLYLGWLVPAVLGGATANIRVLHVGPAGAAAGGSPPGGRTYGLIGSTPSVVSFGIDAATDGGMWLAWQTIEESGPGTALPGALRVLRTTPSGAPATGWTSSGVELAPYDPAFMFATPGWLTTPRAAQVAVAHDGGDGAFVLDAQGDASSGALLFHPTLRHVDGGGTSFSGWTPTGLDMGDIFTGGMPDPGAPASLRAFADGLGGVYAGLPWFASEFTAAFSFARFDPAGATVAGGIGTNQQGIEYAARGDGGMFIASFKPSGATSIWDGDAYVSVGQSSGATFFESKTSYSATRYGDIGLTATRDGGAIFAWSQLIDRQGVYAVRLNPAGVVTGVPPQFPSFPKPALSARFVRGRGVGVRATLPGTRVMAATLYDVTGRAVMRVGDLASGATVERWLPGTSRLESGVYFLRVVDATGVSRGQRSDAWPGEQPPAPEPGTQPGPPAPLGVLRSLPGLGEMHTRVVVIR